MITKKFQSKTNYYKVSVKLTAEEAKKSDAVLVLGDFNEWSYNDGVKLRKSKDGSFSGSFDVPAGRDYHFRYLLNGSSWTSDTQADRLEPSPLHPHVKNAVISCPSAAVKATATKASAPKAAAPKKAPAAAAPKKATATTAKATVAKATTAKATTAVAKKTVAKKATPAATAKPTATAKSATPKSATVKKTTTKKAAPKTTVAKKDETTK